MSLDDLRWFDLFGRRLTRRDFLRVGGSAAALVTLGGALPARHGERGPRFRDDPFELGVASGDPLPDGVVLWTRLNEEAVAQAAGRARSRIPVRWEIAEDETFRRMVRTGESLAIPELGYSIHAEVDGLEPGRVYHYRFLAGGAASPVGRTRTTPAAGARSARLSFAFCSCQNYEDGYYTAFRHMVGEDLDLVVHLGDYIYEGGISRRAVRRNESREVYTLDEYRARYAQYRRDRDLQAAHAAFPWVVTWDDHDVDNNYAGAFPQDRQDPEQFLLRRAAAYQTYYEFLPLRRSSLPRGPDMELYRRLDFGDLASLSVLDTRQYRDDQACGDRLQTDCQERFDLDRTLLGREQERWLLEGLHASRARWNVLAQQVMMAPMEQWNRRGQVGYSMDTWDGYAAERQRLFEAFASGAVASPVVLTGDIHSSWVADLHLDDPDSPVVGTELVCTSITTNGDGLDVAPEDDPFLQRNPHFHFHDERRGYSRCDLTPELLTVRFRAVPYITQPDAPLETRAVFVVENGRPGAIRDG